MFKNKAILALASALCIAPAAIHAQGVTPTAAKGGTVSADQLVQRYTALGGPSPYGEGNAKSLVAGLRAKQPIDLKGAVTVQCPTPISGTTPPPPPRPGPGAALIPPPPPPPPPSNCTTVQTISFTPPTDGMGFGNIDIALALTEAKLAPVTSPNPQQLKDALLEILNKRAAGDGWGEIAKGYGFQLK